jgi:electron transport complex protein RnfE
MISSETRDIIANGLWKQNPGIVQLLGLCPLLAISNNVVNALSLGLATTLVMALSSGSVALLRNVIPHEIRIPTFVLIIAALVTVLELLMHAWALPLYVVLGIFLPLITTNCIILARVEAFASKRSTTPSILDAPMMGLGLTAVLVALGAMREIFGKGTLFSGADLAFGPHAKAWVLQIFPDYQGFLLAILPPGAFIGLGLLIALRNLTENLRAERAAKNEAQRETKLPPPPRPPAAVAPAEHQPA